MSSLPPDAEALTRHLADLWQRSRANAYDPVPHGWHALAPDLRVICAACRRHQVAPAGAAGQAYLVKHAMGPRMRCRSCGEQLLELALMREVRPGWQVQLLHLVTRGARAWPTWQREQAAGLPC